MIKRRLCALFVFAMSFLLLVACSKSNIKYPAGRDTVALFGDGTFQIGRSNEIGLYYSPDGSCLIPCVDVSYETKDNAYIIGHQGESYKIYAVIDLQENTLQFCAILLDPSAGEFYVDPDILDSGDVLRLPEFEDFSEDDQKILQDMENDLNQKKSSENS